MSDEKIKGKKHDKIAKNKLKKEKKSQKQRFSKKHPKISLALKILLVIILVIVVIFTGIVVGMVYGTWGENFKITEEELVIGSSNSIILDKDGNKLAELKGDENRKIVKLEQMPENLLDAYVSIEDERFYDHHGVDFKRTGAAILKFVTNGGKSSFGGSTITQQLVKNITSDDEKNGAAGIIRKVKEWAKAYQIERMLSKKQILELYLNIIFVGANNYGVQVGAEYYFNKSVSDLDLAECAFLAGINNSPNAYNPYEEKDHTDLIKERTKIVLDKMLELGKIEKSEYDEAIAKVNEGFKFEKASSTGSKYSYHTEATIEQVISDIAEQKHISKNLASTYVYSSGLTISSTQNTTLQSQMEEVMADNGKKYMEKSKTPGVNSQAAMVIIDNETSYVVGVVGGLGEKTESRGLNRATQSTRQTGSSIKPLASLVPGINEGIITAATVYNDNKTDFGIKGWDPKNDHNRYKGFITIRSATASSQNIPFIKVIKEMGTAKSIEYLEKMGITTIDKVNDGLASLSLGGFTKGISPLEMAGAYTTIANNGVYKTPLLYTKVTDLSGNTVLEPKQKTEQVMSEQAAYVIKDILKTVVSSGTATYCKISGIDVGAKTGTTNNNYDRWLCGFTNYYTASCWYGYDQNEEVKASNNPAGQIWSAVMTKVHAGKSGSTFKMPSGVVRAQICKASGKKATSKCTDTYSEVFVEGTVPGNCDGHSNSAKICNESGLLATDNCKDVSTKYYSYTVEKEKLGLWKTPNSGSSAAPKTYCTIHKGNASEEKQSEEPTLTLKGEANITINVGDTYKEQGATANDAKDGDISNKIKISGTVNTSKAGTYPIKYTVTNSKNKTKEVTRTVIVKSSKTNEAKPNTSSNTPANTTANTTTNTATNTSPNKNETKPNTTTNTAPATNTTTGNTTAGTSATQN